MGLTVIFRNWWCTYPPGSLNSSIWVKNLRARRTVLEKNKKKKKSTTEYEQYSKIVAFSSATQSSIARDCKRELKAATRGTLGSLAMFYWVSNEGEQWQAYQRLFLLPRF